MYKYYKIGVLLLSMFIGTYLSGYSLAPSKEYISNPDSLGLGIEWKDILVHSTDSINIALRIWQPLVQNESNQTCIIMAGGDKGNLSYYTLHAAALCIAGYQVIQFDYRGFGKSTEVDLDYDYLYYDFFVQDLEAVVHFAQSQKDIHSLGVLGISMGTIIAQEYLIQNKLDFAIMESLILNPVITAKRLEAQDSELNILVPKSGYDFERRLKKIKTPTLVFAGTNDQLSLLREANKFCKQRKKKRLLFIYKGGHAEAFKQMTENTFGDHLVVTIQSFLNSRR